MCILVIKGSGVRRPTDKQFRNMMERNPDGFGLAFVKKGEVIVKKTMNPKTYLKWVRKVDDGTPALFHMRIATHGSVTERNCHPFIDQELNVAFAHNGVLPIDAEGDMTDSETAFRRVFAPLMKAGHAPGSEVFDLAVKCLIGTSRFTFISGDGTIARYGNFIQEGGLLFSNASYEDWNDYGFRLPLKKERRKEKSGGGAAASGVREYLSVLDDASLQWYMENPDYGYYDFLPLEEEDEEGFASAFNEAVQDEYDLRRYNMSYDEGDIF